MSAVCTKTWQAIKDWAARAWQPPGLAVPLAEPLPVQAMLQLCQGGCLRDERQLDNAADALICAIDKTYPPLCVLVGAPGTGKTTAMLWLASRLADKALASDAEVPMPVHVDLAVLAGQQLEGDLDLVLRHALARRAPIDYSTLDPTRMPVLFLVDGLDLHTHDGTAARLLEHIAKYATSPLRRFVVSTRHLDYVRPSPSFLSSFTCVELTSLSRGPRDDWLRTTLGATAFARFSDEWRLSRRSSTPIDNPLLCTMAVCLALGRDPGASKRSFKYPGRTGLFDAFVCSLERRAVQHGRQPLAEHVYEVGVTLERLAFTAAQRGYSGALPIADCDALLVESASAPPTLPMGYTTHLWSRAKKLAMASGLITHDGEAMLYRFLHQQFGEYFAGRYFATRLKMAAASGYLEAELWTLFEFHAFDGIVAFAVGILSAERDGRDLVRRIFHAATQVDCAAACGLVEYTDPQLACKLLQPLVDEEYLPDYVLLTLGCFHTDRARQVLRQVAVSADHDFDTRYVASVALADMDPAAGMKVLRRLYDESADARLSLAPRLLGYLVHSPSIGEFAPLIAHLCQNDPLVRCSVLHADAARQLCNADHPLGLQLLRDLLDAEGVAPFCQFAALDAIAERFPQLAAELRTELRCAGRLSSADELTLRWLQAVRTDEYDADVLEWAVTSRDDCGMWQHAVEMLGERDRARAESLLTSMARDATDYDDRVAAAEVLARWRARGAEDVLAAMCVDTSCPPTRRVRAVAALAALAPESRVAQEVFSGLLRTAEVMPTELLVQFVPPSQLRELARDRALAVSVRCAALSVIMGQSPGECDGVLRAVAQDTTERIELRVKAWDYLRSGVLGEDDVEWLWTIYDCEESTTIREECLWALVDICPGRMLREMLVVFKLPRTGYEIIHRIRREMSDGRTGEHQEHYEDAMVRMWANELILGAFAEGQQSAESSAARIAAFVRDGKIRWSQLDSLAQQCGLSLAERRCLGRAAGRRVLHSDSETELNAQIRRRSEEQKAPRTVESDTGPQKPLRSGEKMSPDTVLTMFFARCRQDGVLPTLGRAEEWSISVGSPWSKSHLQRSVVWKSRHQYFGTGGRPRQSR